MIWCESSAGIVSNRVGLQVINCDRMELDAPSMEIRIGERRRIRAAGITSTGQRHEGIRVNWTSDSGEVARIGLGGIVTGLGEGKPR